MTDDDARKHKPTETRSKRQVALFFFVLMLSSALMYMDMAMRFRP